MPSRSLLHSLRLAILALAALACPAWGTPAQVIFLRHGEKPAAGSELNERGWQRANALPRLFREDLRVLEHGTPCAIFSGSPPAPGGSVRSVQTMQPTGTALGVKVDTRFNRDRWQDLVRAILEGGAYDGKTVLVCWEHKKIPLMVRALGWANGPAKWQDDTFDRLWILDFRDGRPVRFRDLPQRLLPGDSKD